METTQQPVNPGYRRLPYREELVGDAGRLYAEGMSLRAVAEELGIVYSTAHRLVLEAGVPLRKRGGPKKVSS